MNQCESSDTNGMKMGTQWEGKVCQVMAENGKLMMKHWIWVFGPNFVPRFVKAVFRGRSPRGLGMARVQTLGLEMVSGCDLSPISSKMLWEIPKWKWEDRLYGCSVFTTRGKPDCDF